MDVDEDEQLPVFTAEPSTARKRSARNAPKTSQPKKSKLKQVPKKNKTAEDKHPPKTRITKWPAKPQPMICMMSGSEIIMPPDDFQPDSTVYPRPDVLVCSICGETKRFLDELVHHRMNHGPENRCTICTGVRFNTPLELSLHFLQHGHCLECPVCISKYFTNPAKFYHHLKYECGPRNWKYQCNYCLHTFPESFFLDDHNCLEKMYANHKKNTKQRDNQKSKKIRAAIDFEQSNDSIVSFFTLPEIPDNFTVPMKRLRQAADKYECITCSIQMTSLKDLLDHWHFHKYNTKCDKVFRCPFCKNIRVNNEIELLLHFTRHGVPQKCPYECLTSPFKKVDDMLLHVKRCQPKKWDFKCSHCKRMCPLEGGHATCNARRGKLETRSTENENKKQGLLQEAAEKRLSSMEETSLAVQAPVVTPLRHPDLPTPGAKIGADRPFIDLPELDLPELASAPLVSPPRQLAVPEQGEKPTATVTSESIGIKISPKTALTLSTRLTLAEGLAERIALESLVTPPRPLPSRIPLNPRLSFSEPSKGLTVVPRVRVLRLRQQSKENSADPTAKSISETISTGLAQGTSKIFPLPIVRPKQLFSANMAVEPDQI